MYFKLLHVVSAILLAAAALQTSTSRASEVVPCSKFDQRNFLQAHQLASRIVLADVVAMELVNANDPVNPFFSRHHAAARLTLSVVETFHGPQSYSLFAYQPTLESGGCISDALVGRRMVFLLTVAPSGYVVIPKHSAYHSWTEAPVWVAYLEMLRTLQRENAALKQRNQLGNADWSEEDKRNWVRMLQQESEEDARIK